MTTPAEKYASLRAHMALEQSHVRRTLDEDHYVRPTLRRDGTMLCGVCGSDIRLSHSTDTSTTAWLHRASWSDC